MRDAALLMKLAGAMVAATESRGTVTTIPKRLDEPVGAAVGPVTRLAP